MPPPMSERESFLDLQYRFTAHMRDPDGAPAPEGIEDRRLGIYRDLLYRNVEGFMANAFPVVRRLYDDSAWHAMIRDYYARHQSRTPLFPRMPREFLHYLAEERDDAADPPYLAELAHYEWLEAEVGLDTRELDDVETTPGLDLLGGAPVANPVMRAQAYAWPVHRIGPDYRPDEPPDEPTYLVVYRDRDDAAGFMELNAVSARLLDLILAADGVPGRSLLERIAAELGHPDPAVVIEGGREILDSFLERGIVLGAVPAAG